MKAYTITIPIRYNDGELVPLYLFQTVGSELLEIYGGFTRVIVDGQWQDGDKVLHDQSWLYTIYSDGDKRLELEKIACWICHIWKQESVLITMADIDTYFVKATDHPISPEELVAIDCDFPQFVRKPSQRIQEESGDDAEVARRRRRKSGEPAVKAESAGDIARRLQRETLGPNTGYPADARYGHGHPGRI